MTMETKVKKKTVIFDLSQTFLTFVKETDISTKITKDRTTRLGVWCDECNEISGLVYVIETSGTSNLFLVIQNVISS